MAQQDMTVGAFLNSAEAHLATNGGYSAIAECEERVVRLFHRTPGEEKRCISEAPLPDGLAGEDVASRLLEAHADAADPEELRFAREVFFPILFR